MAVNIPLVEAAGVSGASRLPQSYPGEMIVLERSGVECEMVDAVSKWKSVKGVMFLTSLRLVFVVDVKELAKSRYESVEFPLQGVWDEELKQPIFGCNHIKFTSQFYDGQPFEGTLVIKMYFTRGGVGTFVPALNWALTQARRALQRVPQMQPVNPDLPFMSSSDVTSMQSSAFVDPSDVTVIYTTQPVMERSAQPSSRTLRRRNVGSS
uniref:VASt domain-containing protein n=1 Tax=Erythrolobus madagascarensis TaxID=708628 RepID=A0A7S0T5K2_9RHOD|mmetsp:Transcript_3727/g.8196  ORF Transcript_3727/g.8196 Transcript_3727/m.8196 type:complete len:209 (+) Transcript_3727:44-670(+)